MSLGKRLGRIYFEDAEVPACGRQREVGTVDEGKKQTREGTRGAWDRQMETVWH